MPFVKFWFSLRHLSFKINYRKVKISNLKSLNDRLYIIAGFRSKNSNMLLLIVELA